jgi:hypothetical protein
MAHLVITDLEMLPKSLTPLNNYLKSIRMKKSLLPGLFTSRGCRRRRCEERSDSGNLMLVAENDEITTLSSIARDDVVVHRACAVTK